MVKRHSKAADGKYHIHGHKYEILIGSRAQVWHNTAYKTSGGLTHSHLMMNKHGRVVSKKKHTTAKRENRLKKHGYTAKKGKFGAVKIGSPQHKHSSSPKRRKRRSSSRKSH